MAGQWRSGSAAGIQSPRGCVDALARSLTRDSFGGAVPGVSVLVVVVVWWGGCPYLSSIIIIVKLPNLIYAAGTSSAVQNCIRLIAETSLSCPTHSADGL